MDYNRENLVRLIRQFPVLWDPNDQDHRSLNKRDDAATTIGNSFREPKSKEYVLKEWNSIKIYYQSRVRDMEKRRLKTSIEKKPKWELFEPIHEFLGPLTSLQPMGASVRAQHQRVQQQPMSSSNSTDEKFEEFFSDYNEEGMNVNAINERFETVNAVNESFGTEANGAFGAKMLMLSKQNVDDDIQSFLNSIRPTLKKLSVNDEIFEDAKFQINALLHEKYKELRGQLKEGLPIF